jgi:hypothetical protein
MTSFWERFSFLSAIQPVTYNAIGSANLRLLFRSRSSASCHDREPSSVPRDLLQRGYPSAPDTLGRADLQGYFEHLVIERGLAPASVRLSYNGIRFLYVQVLAWPAVDLDVALPKRPQRIPGLLTCAD